MADYLRGTGRELVANEADKIAAHLTADAEVYEQPGKIF
jgi:aconitate hydratase